MLAEKKPTISKAAVFSAPAAAASVQASRVSALLLRALSVLISMTTPYLLESLIIRRLALRHKALNQTLPSLPGITQHRGSGLRAA